MSHYSMHRGLLATAAGGLCSLTASAAVDLLRKREISPVDLVEAAISRIEAIDPTINALPIRRFEQARMIARSLKPATATESQKPGWLGGLPIAIKDYNDVAGSPTTYGSPIYVDNIAAKSDLTVANLEQNGAIAIAKSNVPEFAGANTFNTLYGSTLNPWNTELTAGGTSGGSAAALASGMVWLATGSDIGGSLRIPASYCGIVGMRPSTGRVPRPASLAPFDALWVEGQMGRCVADVALMLDSQAYFDARDPLSWPPPAVPYVNAVRAPRAPQRLGYTGNLGIGRIDPEVDQLCRNAAMRFGDAGTVVDDQHPDFSGSIEAFQTLNANLVATVRGSLYQVGYQRISSEIIGNIRKGLQQNGVDLTRAERLRGELFMRLMQYFETHDILACPTAAVAAYPVMQRFPDDIDGVEQTSHLDWMYLTFALSLTGCPVISVPIGTTCDGRPVSLQLLGKPRSDFELLSAAQILEQLVSTVPSRITVSTTNESIAFTTATIRRTGT